MSFHGLPARSCALGDPYHYQCQRDGAPAGRAAGRCAGGRLVCASRAGSAARAWLEPYTEPTLRTLARKGVDRVDVMCPGFATDCLETLEEIDQEARAAFLAAGGTEFHYIPCLNDQPALDRGAGEHGVAPPAGLADARSGR